MDTAIKTFGDDGIGRAQRNLDATLTRLFTK
jgi:hypothetical protein